MVAAVPHRRRPRSRGRDWGFDRWRTRDRLLRVQLLRDDAPRHHLAVPHLTLALEEQFYLLWPLALIVSVRWGRRAVFSHGARRFGACLCSTVRSCSPSVSTVPGSGSDSTPAVTRCSSVVPSPRGCTADLPASPSRLLPRWLSSAFSPSLGDHRTLCWSSRTSYLRSRPPSSGGWWPAMASHGFAQVGSSSSDVAPTGCTCGTSVVDRSRVAIGPRAAVARQVRSPGGVGVDRHAGIVAIGRVTLPAQEG